MQPSASVCSSAASTSARAARPSWKVTTASGKPMSTIRTDRRPQKPKQPYHHPKQPSQLKRTATCANPPSGKGLDREGRESVSARKAGGPAGLAAQPRILARARAEPLDLRRRRRCYRRDRRRLQVSPRFSPRRGNGPTGGRLQARRRCTPQRNPARFGRPPHARRRYGR